MLAIILARRDIDAVVDWPRTWVVVGTTGRFGAGDDGTGGNAWRSGQDLEETMAWEAVVTIASLLLLIALLCVSGGLSSPTLFVLLLWAPYLGMSVMLWYTGTTLALMLAAVPISGWYTHTLQDAWPAAVSFSFVATALVVLTYLYASDLYAERFTAEELEAAITERVSELSVVLARAADGDLAVDVPSVTQGAGDNAHTEQLDLLTVSLGRTVESLRGLVGSVRVGGESIGSAASQVLVAAREQAASASEQSSAVAETTATIEELAATAAQIAETSGQVAVFASETLGFAEAGSVGGGGVGCGDGFDCVAGGSDCGAGVGVGGEGSGDWSDFGGD